MQVKRFGKLAVALSIMVLFCFVFAGAALANPPMDIDPDQVKANKTDEYTFIIKDLNINAANFYNKGLNITFDGDFDLSQSAGKAFFIEATLKGEGGGTEVKQMQVVPEINGNTATFVIQSANLEKEVYIKKLVINDLIVKSPCKAGEYNVKVWHDLDDLLTTYNSIRVVDTITKIEITDIITSQGNGVAKAGTPITVNGRITANCGDEPWKFSSWDVWVGVYDLKSRKAIVPVEGDCPPPCPTYTEDGRPVGVEMELEKTSVSWDGSSPYATFTATVTAPGYEYKNLGEWTNEYVIGAGTYDVMDNYTIPSSVLVPEAGGSVIITSDPVHFNYIPAEPVCFNLTGPDTMKLNKMEDLTITLKDKYCNNASAVKDEKFDLAAFTEGEGERSRSNSVLAGRFYDFKTGEEISHVYIGEGQKSVKVKFRPIVDGPIVIEARNENLTSNIHDVLTATLYANVQNDWGTPSLQIDPAAPSESGDPLFGWLLKGKYWIESPGATETYRAYVDIKGPNGNYFFDLNGNGIYDRGEEWAKWDTEANDCYMATGRFMGHNLCQPWDTMEHPFCTTKKDFYIYPNPKLKAELLGRSLSVTVVIPDNVNIGASNTVTVGPFVDPVELTRNLEKDTWQVISTPKYLAKPAVDGQCNGYGNFADLGLKPGSIDVLAWFDGGWNFAFGDDALSVVPDPLVAYYVRMHQMTTPGDTQPVVAEYIFARTAVPGESVPPTRLLGLGWNSVGVSVQDRNVGLLPIYTQPGNIAYQSDYMYRFLGTVLDGAKIVYNPVLGNLAEFGTIAVSDGSAESWALDPVNAALNGDCYWIYMKTAEELAGNDGLDMLKL